MSVRFLKLSGVVIPHFTGEAEKKEVTWLKVIPVVSGATQTKKLRM